MRSPSARRRSTASAVLALIGSATARRPATAPSTAANSTVCPSARSVSARSARVLAPTPCSSSSFRLPSATARPATRPRTPRPVDDSKDSAGSWGTPRDSAPRTIAAASGCSLLRSSAAASARSDDSSKPGAGSTPTSCGRPSVSVPVLSTTRVSTCRSTSIASASRKSTPACAPFPVATMIESGVASPSAQGQAMISTATAFSSACAMRGSGPTLAQTAKVRAATASTAGTNTAETRSAMRWIGARLRCASATVRTICASKVSAPTRSARITSAPSPLRVAPVTRSPDDFATGNGSPVSMDSSTWLAPSSTTPSVGTFSPGRTRSRSPTRTRSSGTSCSLPSASMRRAVFGASPSSARIADPVW